VVKAISEALQQGLSQKTACAIFGIECRKFRRWLKSKPLKPRVAWNAVGDHERQAIINAAYKTELIDKPLSHIYTYGHDSGEFFASLSSVWRILKAAKVTRSLPARKRTRPYVGAHDLLDQGFSLLCYDATEFKTDTGVIVWALPVIVLPSRFLLTIGHSIGSFTSKDLVKAVMEAHALIPDVLNKTLLAHSDRGSAMKSSYTRNMIKDLLGAPVHYGRPHTPNDQPWIESFIKTLKYHRDRPSHFQQVDDIVRWFNQFPDIYNNDPHSALQYVTPSQALQGKQEVIIRQRKCNLLVARSLRYAAWKAAYSNKPSLSGKDLVPSF
jgi:transposase InsO family protein